MSSSSSSSHTSSPSPSPEPQTHRKRKRASNDVHETTKKAPDTHDSDATSDSGDEEQQPQDDEAPVLSHAAQRKERKRAKLEAKAAHENSKDKKSSDRKGKGQDKADLPKRQNSVWVGNLSFKTTESSLRKFFDGAGEITRINLPTRTNTDRDGRMRGENRGFAYVDFSSPDAKTIAITLSEKNLDGRRLLIKDGDDFAGRPSASTTIPAAGEGTEGGPSAIPKGLSKTAQKILRAQKQPPAPTLFVGNLGFEATEDSLRQMLLSHVRIPKDKEKDKEKEKEGSGEENPPSENTDRAPEKILGLRKIRMGTFEDTGNCKGFAFLDFLTIEHATTVLTNPRNQHLDGRKLTLEYASADAVRRGGGGGGVGKGRHHPGGGRPEKTWKTHDASEDADDGSMKQFGSKWKREIEQQASKDNHNHGRGEERQSETRPSYARNDSRPGRRPKPGAALALAKRENVAIVPSEGKKLTFT